MQMLTAVAALLALVGQTATPTAASIIERVERQGAKAVVDDLYGAKQWGHVIIHISRGEPGWVALAPRLAKGSDAWTSESLGLALADALPKNPSAVLAALDLADGPVLGPSRVCTMPFIEPTDAFLRQYRVKAIAALTTVSQPKLAEARKACLAKLQAMSI